jgi:uncharacterized protein
VSDSLKAQSAVLLDLKRLDEQSQRFKVGLRQLPDDIAQVEAKQKELEDNFAAARAAVAEAEKKLRQAEQDLKSKEDEMFKAEGKMMDVKTNEEYSAAMRENENRKAAKGLLEEKTLALMDDLEEQRQLLASLEKEHVTEEARLQAAKKHLLEQSAVLKVDVDASNAIRDGFAAKLDPKLQALYRKVTIDIDSIAIAYATAGACVGCHMKLRPQIYNETVGYVAIHQCGSCRRILIPPPTASSSSTENVAASTQAD